MDYTHRMLPNLSHEEILRYSRHLLIPDVGLEGQCKLKAASVLIIGAGGLGSPVALYVAAPYDLIIDGSDNFPTRYLTNDLCVLTGKPNVYGSVYRFDGQVSVFDARKGPCYRCLFPNPPPPGLVPSCSESGVLGIVPGTIGTLQATEVLQLGL